MNVKKILMIDVVHEALASIVEPHGFICDDGTKWSREEVLKNIFKGFVFSTPVEIKTSQGFGLGLYLSAGLVKLLDGEIWLEYSGKTGSKFCFSIPIVNE